MSLQFIYMEIRVPDDLNVTLFGAFSCKMCCFPIKLHAKDVVITVKLAVKDVVNTVK